MSARFSSHAENAQQSGYCHGQFLRAKDLQSPCRALRPCRTTGFAMEIPYIEDRPVGELRRPASRIEHEDRACIAVRQVLEPEGPISSLVRFTRTRLKGSSGLPPSGRVRFLHLTPKPIRGTKNRHERDHRHFTHAKFRTAGGNPPWKWTLRSTTASTVALAVPSGASDRRPMKPTSKPAIGEQVPLRWQGRPPRPSNPLNAKSYNDSEVWTPDQRLIDMMMIDLDATENKSRLGANAILASRCASPRLGAEACHCALPLYGGANARVACQRPMMKHSFNGEAMLTTRSTSGNFRSCRSAPRSLTDSVRMGAEVSTPFKEKTLSDRRVTIY